MVERRAPGVERRPARARLNDPAADPPRARVVRVVEGVAVRDAPRVDDARTALGGERDVVTPRATALVGVVVDVVEPGRVQRHVVQRPQPPATRGEQLPSLEAQVVKAVLPVLRVPVGEDPVDRVVAPDVLRVGPLCVAELDELARWRPLVAVVRPRERRVPRPAAPEEPDAAPEPDRVGVRVAQAAGHVHLDGPHPAELADRVRVQRDHVAHDAGDAGRRQVVPGVRREEDDDVPVLAEDERRVVVVVAPQALEDHLLRQPPLLRQARDPHVPRRRDPARERVPVVGDRARVAEVRPGSRSELTVDRRGQSLHGRLLRAGCSASRLGPGHGHLSGTVAIGPASHSRGCSR